MKLRRISVVFVLFIVIAFCVAEFIGQATALPFGLPQYVGFFKGEKDPCYKPKPPTCLNVLTASSGGYAIPSWVNDSASFESFILGHLDSGILQDRVGAAFIIQTMRYGDGECPGDSDKSLPPTDCQVNDWLSTVDYYATNGQASFDWATTQSFKVNSYYQPTDHDDAFYNGPGDAKSIVFYSDSKHTSVQYAIKRFCGNPVGDLIPLRKPTKATPHCDGFSLNPPAPDPSTTFDVTAKFNFTPTPLDGGAAAIAAGDKIYISVTGPASHSNTFTPSEMPPGDQNTIGATMSMTAGASGGTYNVDYRLLNKSGGVLLDCSGSFDITVASCTGPGSVVPRPLEPGQPFTITATLSYNPPAAAGSAFSSDRFYIKITGQPATLATPQPPSGGNVSFKASFPGVPTTGSYSYTYYSTGPVAPVGPGKCMGSFDVADQPYFSVTGGDVQTGDCMYTSPDNTTSTNPDSDGSVVGWNLERPNYGGAGSQYAAMALGYLQDFSTAQSSNGGSYLGFANTTNVIGSGSGADTYGGGFISYPQCATDYFNPSGGQPVLTGDQSITGRTILNGSGAGSHQTIYVKGNAFVNGSIVYSGSGSYADVTQIPSFALIVQGGNIYISPGVTQLDGLYVAEPDTSGKGGTIYTCTKVPSIGLTGGDPNLIVDPNYFTSCRNRLTVNGAFAARQVELLRTAGRLNSGNPAETFNFTPDVWLTIPPIGGAGNSAGTNAYDAITSLPPTL